MRNNTSIKISRMSSSDSIQLKPQKIIGRTALMLCSLIENDTWAYNIAQMLLERGASLDAIDSNGHNPLMYACIYQRSNLIQLFLNNVGDYGLLKKDRMGNTVFHLASLGVYYSIINFPTNFIFYKNNLI